MSIQDRIDGLNAQISAQKEQRDWLSAVDWQDSAGDAGAAISECDRIITIYEKLISQLEARL